MPKAAAAPEAKNEPFIPEPLADTAKSLGLVAEAPVSEARTEASISQARDLGSLSRPRSAKGILTGTPRSTAGAFPPANVRSVCTLTPVRGGLR